jgi:hypothetical protein
LEVMRERNWVMELGGRVTMESDGWVSYLDEVWKRGRLILSTISEEIERSSPYGKVFFKKNICPEASFFFGLLPSRRDLNGCVFPWSDEQLLVGFQDERVVVVVGKMRRLLCISHQSWRTLGFELWIERKEVVCVKWFVTKPFLPSLREESQSYQTAPGPYSTV